jgi:hypothetical protein
MEETWKKGLDWGAPGGPKGTCPHSHPGRASPRPLLTSYQLFTDAQQLQPLQVYQAPLSLATVPHQALGRTQSSPAAPGGMKSPPDQPTKHLFTTGKPHRHLLHAFTMHQSPVCGIQGRSDTLEGGKVGLHLSLPMVYSW